MITYEEIQELLSNIVYSEVIINTYDCLSLFDGISIAKVALKDAGISINKYLSSEIDKNAIAISFSNHRDIIRLGSVKDIKIVKLGGNLVSINGNLCYNVILIGGSPCQGFSINGLMQGTNTTEDITITTTEEYIRVKDITTFKSESILIFEYVRILRQLTPKYFILENVKLTPSNLAIFNKEVGVDALYINSNLFSAQDRYRLYWTNIPINPLPNECILSIKDIIPNPNYSDLPLYLYNLYGGTPRYNKVRNISRCKCHTLLASMYRGNISSYLITNDKTKVHKITPKEAEQFQTLPIGYTSGYPTTARLKAIGNGFTKDVIVHILKGIKQ